MARTFVGCVLLCLFIALVSADSPCGTYSPRFWVQDGQSVSDTLQYGSPLTVFLGMPLLFGCTPSDAYSHLFNATFHFDYLDSQDNSWNGYLLTKSDYTTKTSSFVCKTDYDDSYSGLAVATHTEMDLTPSQEYIDSHYDEHGIIQTRSSNLNTNDLASLIGTQKSKVRRPHRVPLTSFNALKNPALLLGLDDSNYFNVKEQYYYDGSVMISNLILKINSSTSNPTYQEMHVSYFYKLNANANIVEVKMTAVNSTNSTLVNRFDYYYEDTSDSNLVTKICLNGCANFNETFHYDDNGRFIGLDSWNSLTWSHYKIKYNGDDLDTADFDYFGVFDFHHN